MNKAGVRTTNIRQSSRMSLGRSSADLNPLLVGDIGLWLRADTLALNDGDAVSTWKDSGPFGRDASGGGGTANPTYKTSIVNGRPVVRFDGANDYMTGAQVVSAAGATIFAVAMIPSQVGNIGIVWQQWSSGDTISMYREIATGGLRITVSANLESFFVSGGVFHLLGGTWNGGSSRSGVEGQYVTGNSGTSSYAGSYFLCNWRGGSPQQYQPWDIAELIIYTSALTSDQRIAIEDYLAAKYALTIMH